MKIEEADPPSLPPPSSRIYPNSNKEMMSQLRQRQNESAAQELSTAWDRTEQTTRTLEGRLNYILTGR